MKITVKDLKGQTILAEDLPDERLGISIGRSEDNDIILQRPEISPRHFLIDADDTGVFIYDNNSINGVTLDGKRIGSKPEQVFSGSEICAGDLLFDISSDRITDREVAPAQKPLVRFMIIVCLFLLIAALLKMCSNRNITTIPKPVIEAPEQQTAQVEQLLSKAQKAYFLNNTTEAVELFNKVTTIDPSNRRALDFLAEIRRQNLEVLLTEARSAMESGKYEQAARSIGMIKVLAPKDPRLTELIALQDGEQEFSRAKLLFDSGDFASARRILQNIKIIDESRRLRWLRETEVRLSIATDLHDAGEKLNSGDISGALTLLDSGGTADAADNPLASEVNRLKTFAEQVLAFNMALTNKQYAAAIQLGHSLQGSPEIKNYKGVQDQAAKDMDLLKSTLLKQADALRESVSLAVEQADKKINADNSTCGYDLLFQALQDQTVLEFLIPSKETTALRIELQVRMQNYVREVYQRGYILTGMGRFDEAQQLFEATLQCTNTGDEYHQKAVAQLARIRRRLGTESSN